MKKYILCVLLLSSMAHGGYVELSGLKVTKVYAGYTHGGAFLGLDKSIPNPALCDNKGIVKVDANKSDVDHVLSIALSAKISGSNVSIQVYDDVCSESHPVIRRIMVY